jgi:hypothetical protein
MQSGFPSLKGTSNMDEINDSNSAWLIAEKMIPSASLPWFSSFCL